MSWIKQGRSTHSRRAKNYPTAPAQQRLDEHLLTVRDQLENALSIDSVEVIVFKRVRAGTPCVCSKHHVSLESTATGGDFEGYNAEREQETGEIARPATNLGRVAFDIGDSDVFGEGVVENSVTRSREIELGSMPQQNRVIDGQERQLYGQEVFLPGDLEGGSEQCGICYNEGYAPAFEALNYSYCPLTEREIAAISGYWSDSSTTPRTLKQQSENAFVDFEITVPKYFISATYSVRNNLEVYNGSVRLYTANNLPLTLAELNANRGKNMLVRVRNVREFTHVVLVFKLNDYQIRANLSTENEMINYENEVTIGDMNVILSGRAGSIRSEDMLVIPKRNLVLKINGAPRRSTAEKHIWQWVLTARAVQRSEMTAKMFKHYNIY